MRRSPYLKRNLVRGTTAGLAIGTMSGLAQVLILVFVDQLRLPLKIMPVFVMAFGALGFLNGLGLGLLHSLSVPNIRSRLNHAIELWVRQKRTTGPAKSKPASTEPAEERWPRVKRNLVQGIGVGLLAGLIVGLIEIMGLMIVDRSWKPLAGLLYALISYGVLGLLGGLILGLSRGLWCVWRDRDDGPTGPCAWITLATLLISSGTFFVAHNRIRQDIMRIPLRPPVLIEVIFADNALLVATVALAAVFWFLIRWFAPRMWSGKPWVMVGLYVLLILVAIPISGAFRSAPSPAKPAPGTTDAPIASHLRDRPNVLFIVAETLRADQLACCSQSPAQPPVGAGAQRPSADGHARPTTPHLDALARDGLVYSQTISQASWTRPSIATMLTSLYPTSHRATAQDMGLADDVITLPEVLATAGYRTAGFTANIQTAPQFNFHQGYHRYAFLEPELHVLAFDTPVATRFVVFAGLLRLQQVLQFPMPMPPYRDAAGVNQQALTWLEANKDTRFFLFLHYMEPHDPYFAHPYDGTKVASQITPDPDPTQVSYLRQLYAGEITFLDTHLGQLFDQLKAWGLYDDMLIIFTSDHGEEFYEHKGWWHGTTLYEEQIAVPLIVKYPNGAFASTVDEQFARGLDLAPTVLDVAGLPIPEAFQGVSLRPGAAVTRAEFAVAELDNIGTIRAIHTRRYKLITASRSNPRGLAPVELYDLQNDPGERRNLAASEPDTVHQLQAVLDQIMAFAEASAVAGQSGELDAATRERLRQLGY